MYTFVRQEKHIIYERSVELIGFVGFETDNLSVERLGIALHWIGKREQVGFKFLYLCVFTYVLWRCNMRTSKRRS